MDAGASLRRSLVVVGGGVAGALIAKHMQFDSDITLIDTKEYYEIPWAWSRSMVEPSFAERSLIKHKDYLVNGRVETSPAIDVTEKEVLMENGQTIAYDYLVVATGHASGALPRNRRDRLEQFQQASSKIKSSYAVLIIGGGRRGVELAGEIAVDYPEKKVILVHEGSRLLDMLGPKASSKVLQWLTSKGVEVLLEQSIDVDSISEGDSVFRTSAGRSITADCYFVCVGRPLGSSWLRETILKDKLDTFERLIVDQNLRVEGRSNIFAIGDITDVREIKHGLLAHRHAAAAARNLKLLMRGGDSSRENRLVVYKPPTSPPAFVSLGRKQAVAQFSFTTVVGRVPGVYKSRDLFVGKNRKRLGLEPQVAHEHADVV